jgi:3',5'-cyclic-AMP phosphodiesterase
MAMPCCGLSRRELARWSAVVAATPLLLVADPEQKYALADGSGADAVGPVNLELVTLTETSAILTWYTGVPGTNDGLGRMVPAPADAEVRYGTHPARLTATASGPAGTPYHYVELTGLEPGQTYYYQARSRGRVATPTPFTLITGEAAGVPMAGSNDGVFSFTTPQPPPGRFLFSIALCNDLHLGETIAGLTGAAPGIKGISQVPGEPPYPRVMAAALVDEARARGARYLLAAGDVSAEAAPTDLDEARRLLDGFGVYRRDYLVTRGNHDRAHSGAVYARCTVGRWPGNDCFGDAFFGGSTPTYFTHDLHGLRVLGLDTYDKPGNGGDAGGLSAEQLAWFRAELAHDRDRPTLVFGHHPLVVTHSPFPITAGNSLDAAQAHTILTDYAATPGVVLHHAGHTHRNKRTVSPTAPNVVLQEVSAVKEYPGGFSLLRIHTGGYALNYYKSRTPLAREWSERSRQEILGLWPQYALGSQLTDRNSVVRRDLSGLRCPPGLSGGAAARP